MTPENILTVVEQYRYMLNERGIDPVRHADTVAFVKIYESVLSGDDSADGALSRHARQLSLPQVTQVVQDGRAEALEHARWMLGEISRFVQIGKIEKACRWLGFVQGIFWVTGIRLIKQMRDDNRPR